MSVDSYSKNVIVSRMTAFIELGIQYQQNIIGFAFVC